MNHNLPAKGPKPTKEERKKKYKKVKERKQ